MDLVRAHKGHELTAALLADAAGLGPVEFLRLRAVPMITEVGDAWASGEIGIHHEHFFSERLEDVLRTVRLPFERAAPGSGITLAAFSGEQHGLGIQMAALVAAFAGLAAAACSARTRRSRRSWRPSRRSGRRPSASASPSRRRAPRSRDQLEQLRRAIPAAVPILVGGMGARRSHPPGGCVIVEDLQGLLDWMRRLAVAPQRG